MRRRAADPACRCPDNPAPGEVGPPPPGRAVAPACGDTPASTPSTVNTAMLTAAESAPATSTNHIEGALDAYLNADRHFTGNGADALGVRTAGARWLT